MSPFEVGLLVGLLVLAAVSLMRLLYQMEFNTWVKKMSKHLSDEVHQLKPRHTPEREYNKLTYEDRDLLGAQILHVTQTGFEEYWTVRQAIFAYLGGFPVHLAEWRETAPGYMPSGMLWRSNEAHIKSYRQMLLNVLKGDRSFMELCGRIDKLLSTGCVRNLALAYPKWESAKRDIVYIKWQQQLWDVFLCLIEQIGCRIADSDREKVLLDLLKTWEQAEADSRAAATAGQPASAATRMVAEVEADVAPVRPDADGQAPDGQGDSGQTVVAQDAVSVATAGSGSDGRLSTGETHDGNDAVAGPTTG